MSQALKSNPSKPVDLDALCGELLEHGEPVQFEWNGHAFAIITIDDLEHFEDLEDADDIRAANAVLDEMKANGEEPIPWDKIKEKYGFQE